MIRKHGTKVRQVWRSIWRLILFTLLLANIIHAPTVCLAGETLNLVTNGDAETGNTDGWKTFRKVISEAPHSGKFCFSCVGSSMVRSSKAVIGIDPNKTYTLTGWFKSAGKGKSRLFFGYIPYDAKHRRISSEQVTYVAGTETTLAAPCAGDDTVIKVVDASKWKALRSGYIAFKVDDSGKYKDLPNRNLSGRGIVKVENKGNHWEIHLAEKCKQTYPAGTKVREHKAESGYIYNAASSRNVPMKWTKYTGKIKGIAESGMVRRQWPRGTRYARVILMANYTQNKEFELHVDDIVLTAIEDGDVREVKKTSANKSVEKRKVAKTNADKSLTLNTFRKYPVFKLPRKPILNTGIDDGVWSNIALARGFFSTKKCEQYADEDAQTSFKIGWFENNLYIIAECEDDYQGNIKADPAKYRDGPVHDDRIRLNFSQKRYQGTNHNYTSFIANSNGGVWSNAKNQADLMQATGSRGTNSWRVTMKIPFSALSIPLRAPADQEEYCFNLERNRTTGDKATTSFVKNNFRTEAFARLALKSETSTAGKGVKIESRLNKSYCAHLSIKRAELAALTLESVIKAHSRYNEIDQETANLIAAVLRQAKTAPMTAEKNRELCRKYKRIVNGLGAPGKKLRFRVQVRDAGLTKFYINGKEVSPDKTGLYVAKIEEGLAVIGAECVSKGKRPELRIELQEHPETLGRWRVASAADENWREKTFDDTKWNIAALNKKGFFWNKNKGDKLFARQLILWNMRHDGPDMCINPKITEWGFSPDTVEVLFLSLRSPLAFVPGSYEFIMELPEGLRLLSMDNKKKEKAHWRKYKTNVMPIEVKRIPAKLTKPGKSPYTRYEIAYNPVDISPTLNNSSLVPVACEKDKLSPGTTSAIYFYRRGSGNFTELAQAFPVRILPPINGRMPKRFILSQYNAMPYKHAGLSEELNDKYLDQACRAGFNYWTLAFSPTHLAELRLPIARTAKYLSKRGATIGTGDQLFPLWGCKWVKRNLYNFIKNTPAARAKYFNNTWSWQSLNMYCPTYMTTVGKDTFVKLVAKDYKEVWLSVIPQADYFFCNWEQEPWYGKTRRATSWNPAKAGDRSACFCDRCKAAFKEFAGIPQEKKLTDNEIFEKYREEWRQFRYSLDGKIQGLVRDACASIGRKYMLYSWTHQKNFWKQCKYSMHIPFPGCPGSPAADSRMQRHMDNTMKFFRDEVGFETVVGQQFFFLRSSTKRNFARVVASRDGYMHPKSWKTQIIRIAASLHGGVDISPALHGVGGTLYYVGEATRMISEYEPLFVDGVREDKLASSEQIRYPNLLVLTRKVINTEKDFTEYPQGDMSKERLVLLFNESDKPKKVTLKNLDLVHGMTARIYGTDKTFDNPVKMEIIIAPEDVTVIHII